jgi:hypothetical protein
LHGSENGLILIAILILLINRNQKAYIHPDQLHVMQRYFRL